LRPPIKGLVARTVAGAAGSVLAGYLVFRGDLFRVEHIGFRCLTVGMLAAAVFALMRLSRPGQAALLAVAYGLFQLGLARSVGWVAAASGLVVGCGVLLVALIFDMLARRGVLFGKFLLTGPLLAGVYLAATPMAEFHNLTTSNVLLQLARSVYTALLIGDGVGLGVELVDLGELGLSRLRSAAPESATVDGSLD